MCFCVFFSLVSHLFVNCKILSEVQKYFFSSNQLGPFQFGKYTVAFIFPSHMLNGNKINKSVNVFFCVGATFPVCYSHKKLVLPSGGIIVIIIIACLVRSS